VQGEEMLIDAVKRCQASLFTDRAISYRTDNGFDHFKVFLSVAVMQMVRSDQASAGVMFTIDTESGHPDVVHHRRLGPGRERGAGRGRPGRVLRAQADLRAGHRSVLRRTLGDKQVHMVYAPGARASRSSTSPRPRPTAARYCLSDADVLELADAAIKIEDHYSQRAGERRAMDIEWAKDGPDGALYIVQARPETAISQRKAIAARGIRARRAGTVRAQGRAVGAKHRQRQGAHRDRWAPPVGVPARRGAGGRHHHAGLGAGDEDRRRHRHQPRRTHLPRGHRRARARHPGGGGRRGGERGAARRRGGHRLVRRRRGRQGLRRRGEVPQERQRPQRLKRPATEIMVNLGNPELAFQVSQMPCDGVGLARMEFIINEHIKVHPMAVLHPERIADVAEREQVLALSAGYTDGRSYFVERLAEGVGTIAAAFYPRPVIVRLSDFKSNEYAALLGGRDFEPHEENPMLGFRGAARYMHPAYAEGFALECEPCCACARPWA
jgi:pyruvate,water dikinase